MDDGVGANWCFVNGWKRMSPIVLAKEYYEYLRNDTRLEPSDDLPMLPFGARTVRSEYKIHWARRVARQTADGRPQAPAA